MDTIELEISNFGPVVHGKIELRPLTVFVGPSNTGKSYTAILTYALHRHFSARVPLRSSSWPSSVGYERDIQYFGDAARKQLFEWALSEFKDYEQPNLFTIIDDANRQHIPFVLKGPASEFVRSKFTSTGHYLGQELIRCFGPDLDELTRKGSNEDAQIVIRNRSSRLLENDDITFTFTPSLMELELAIPDQLTILPDSRKRHHEFFDELRSVRWLGDSESETRIEFVLWRALDALTRLAKPSIVGLLQSPAYYLPADRTGIMHAHSVVVGALIQQASLAALRHTKPTPVLSGVLADFLEQLIELDGRRDHKSKSRKDRATPIESKILGGRIHEERSEFTGYPSFTYQPKGWKNRLSLMNASSMVSELAPVVLYLRHRVVSGNILIVEEPESHLHPAMQVELTRQLAEVVNSGIRVIVTTHSEWILEELANIVRRSEILPEKVGQQSNGTTSLPSEQVGAWLFKPIRQPKGSVIEEVKIEESGVYASDFDDVATALHNDWADISSKLGEAE